MRPRRQLLALPLLSVPALVVILCLPDRGHGQDKKSGDKTNKKQTEEQKKLLQKLNKAKAEELHFEEAEALRSAYLLLLQANADYAGQKAKAMKEVEKAVKSLDEHVVKHGTDAQKAATKKAEADLAKAVAAVEAAKAAGAAAETQQASDLQVGQAGELLTGIHAVLEKNKQKAVLKHVEHAIKEINTALKAN
jgi:colicin import membrane protein